MLAVPAPQAPQVRTPPQLLIQACGSCHNDVLDQSISRARFNVAIGRLEREEVEQASKLL